MRSATPLPLRRKGGGGGRRRLRPWQGFRKGQVHRPRTVSQLTLGVQLGGDTFSEVIVFENKQALDRFKQGKTAFAANASAVLVKAGAAAANNFNRGCAVFAYSEGGMLLELAIGGQRFKFKPAGGQQQDEKKQAGGKSQQGKGQQGRGQDEGQDQAEDCAEDSGEENDRGEGQEGEQDEEAASATSPPA